MRRLSARSDIFVQSSFGLALALKALLVLWATPILGGVELAKEQAYSFGRCMVGVAGGSKYVGCNNAWFGKTTVYGFKDEITIQRWARLRAERIPGRSGK